MDIGLDITTVYLVGQVIGYKATAKRNVANSNPNSAYVKLQLKHDIFKPHI